MKPCFQNKPLHLTACLLLFWKGISLIMIVCLLLGQAGILHYGEGFLFPTGFTSIIMLLVIAAFSDNRTFTVLMLIVIGILFLTYWVCFILLARNRTGAGVASVGLLVLCGLDLPITLAFSFAEWWSILVCIPFHAAIFITVALLRRSRPGMPIQLNKPPDSI